MIYANVERRGPFCQNCTDTKKWYWNIGDKVGDLTIIDRRALPNTLQEYQYKCNICGFDGSKPIYFRGVYQNNYWVKGRSIKSIQKNGGRGCACCGHRLVQPGINDVATTAQDIINYFLDKKEATMWTKSSSHKVKVICPVCNTVQPNKIEIENLTYEGFCCINCGKNISYPEKFMYFLLKELNVGFEIHKVFEWSKAVYDECDRKFHKREYDFYIPLINTIVEMHGEQHYKKKTSFGDKINLEDRQRIDVAKQSLAEKYCDHYIIIDCRNSNKNYIQNGILESELSNLFDLSDIDWSQISKKASSGIAKLVVENKRKHPEKTTVDLAKEYSISQSTIIEWLKKAGVYDIIKENEIAGLKRSYPIYSPN